MVTGATQETRLPLVSVVIVSHRGERYLREALASVNAQTFHRWEALIVDDQPEGMASSLADTFARSVDRRVVYLRSHGRGPAAARNLAFDAARGTHLAFLDEDDIWLPDHLDAALSGLAAAEADVAFSAVEMFDDESGRTLGPWSAAADELSRFPLGLYLRNYIGILSVVMRLDIVQQHGTFETARSLIYGEDHEYWVRLAFAGVRFVEVPGIHGRYRKGHRSGTSDVLGMRKVHCRVLRRHLNDALAHSVDPDALKAVVAARHSALAADLLGAEWQNAAKHAWWALQISPAKTRMLRSATRRVLARVRHG